jgi:hypothetical protein
MAGARPDTMPLSYRHDPGRMPNAAGVEADLIPAGDVARDIGGHVVQDQIHAPGGEAQAGDRAQRATAVRLSVSSWRTTRQRFAPSAVRTANSRCRAAPRANCRLATLAQAISKHEA